MKACKPISIDPLIAEMYWRKYPRQVSQRIENFMRSELDINIDKESQAEIELEIEKTDRALAQQRILLAQLREKQNAMIAKKVEEIEKRKMQDAQLEKEQADALISIKEYGYDLEFQVSKMKPAEFLAKKLEESQ